MITALHRLLVFVVLLPVVLYRRVISPLKGVPSCRYLPTCSEYATEAVHARGIVIGTALATWRVLRCNPLCGGGYDPVPHVCREDSLGQLSVRSALTPTARRSMASLARSSDAGSR